MLDESDFLNKKHKICVVGLGYVGLPLALLLSRKYNVIGFDIDSNRIRELNNNIDKTKEIKSEILEKASIEFSDNPEIISRCRLIIITVPTPIDQYNKPDLSHIQKATKTVGQHLKKNTIIVFESTVYPGVTEEICVPLLEKKSGLIWKKDFFVGYSPERINPGDKLHSVDKIKKVVSGDKQETGIFLSKIYGSVIPAGIHLSPNIKVAESAKVIENTQRDLNIALMNELSIIFDKMNINTLEVLKAAETKWNFIKFKPGLVGGHCIGVDPYYLTFKAESLGYNPQIILAGRRINDTMGKFVAENTVKKLIKVGSPVKGSKVLILGLTFKENISDIRNTKVVDIYNELKEYGIEVYVHDIHASKQEVKNIYGIDLIPDAESHSPYDAVILAVNHKKYIDELTLENFKKMSKTNTPILIDLKGSYKRTEAEKDGFIYWSL